MIRYPPRYYRPYSHGGYYFQDPYFRPYYPYYPPVGIYGSQISNVDQNLINFGVQTGVSQINNTNQLMSRGGYRRF